MASLKTILYLCLVVSRCAFSYYLPQIAHHPPLPYWSPFYYNWPSPHLNSNPAPLAYRSFDELIERISAESIKQLKQSLNSKRPDVLEVLNVWDVLDESSSNQTSSSTLVSSSRSTDWPLFKKRPASFSKLKPPLFPMRDSNSKQSNDLGRFLYANVGVGNSANYLFKTSYIFTSAVATLCVVSTCIPADQFATGASTVTCRRKRTPSAATFNDELQNDAIEPSNVEKLEATLLPEAGAMTTFTLYPGNGADLPSNSETLRPSFIEDDDGFDNMRQKRFLFLLTSTVTTYSFVTTTYTSRLTLYSTSAAATSGGYLTCRPSNIGIC